MKCPECGAEIGAEEKFCGNCGAPFEAAESSPVVEEPSAPLGDETIITDSTLPPPVESAEPPLPPPSEPVEPMPPPPPVDAVAPPPPPPAAATGEGKSKTGMIIAIAVVVLVVICCCCVVGIGLFLNSDAGQDLLREIDLAMVPALTALI